LCAWKLRHAGIINNKPGIAPGLFEALR